MERLFFLTALLANLLLIGIFYYRKKNDEDKEHLIGWGFNLLLIPNFIVLITFIKEKYDSWMIIYEIIIILFIVLEIVLDYILKIEFRENIRILAPYLILYTLSFWGYIAISFVFGVLFGLIIFVAYAIHTGTMIWAHK